MKSELEYIDEIKLLKEEIERLKAEKEHYKKEMQHLKSSIRKFNGLKYEGFSPKQRTKF